MSDVFIEKIVTKKKTVSDKILIAGFIMLGVVLGLASLFLLQTFGLLLAAGFAYGTWWLVTRRNIEYEYSVTNGDLDVDMIISQRKRKRIFSANCKEFDIVARVSDPNQARELQNVNITNRVKAVSSMESEENWFITTNYKGMRTILFFEPSDKMIDAFRKLIPLKVSK